LLYICAMTPFTRKNNDDDFNDDEKIKGKRVRNIKKH